MKLIAACSPYMPSSGYLWSVVELDHRHSDESESFAVQIKQD